MELTKEQVKEMGAGIVEETMKAAMIMGGQIDDEVKELNLDDPEETAFFREAFKCGYISALVRLGVSKEQVIQVVQFGDLEVQRMHDLIDDGADCICGKCNKNEDETE